MNEYEKQEKLIAQKSHIFPRSNDFDYEVTAEGAVEINYLLLLYTKRDYPFTVDPTPENILRFLANINPSEKFLKTYSLLIKKTR